MLKYTLSGPQLIYNFPYAQTNTRLSNSRKCKPRMNQASFLLALAPQIQWMTPARDPKQYLLVFILPGFEAWHSGPGTWQLGYFWEVCDRSFGSSYSSGLSKGARGVSGAIIAIKHTGFCNFFLNAFKNLENLGVTLNLYHKNEGKCCPAASPHRESVHGPSLKATP